MTPLRCYESSVVGGWRSVVQCIDNSPVNLLVTQMVEFFSTHSHDTRSPQLINKLLFNNESVAVIDNSPKTTALLSHYLTTEGFLNTLRNNLEKS